MIFKKDNYPLDPFVYFNPSFYSDNISSGYILIFYNSF